MCKRVGLGDNARIYAAIVDFETITTLDATTVECVVRTDNMELFAFYFVCYVAIVIAGYRLIVGFSFGHVILFLAWPVFFIAAVIEMIYEKYGE